MPNHSSLSSDLAVDKVASVDDLLTEILSRLLVRPLLRFKSVSKHWYFLISSSRFKLLRSSRNPDPSPGLFIPLLTLNIPLKCEFIQLDIKNPVKPPFRTLNFDPSVDRIDIKHSFNGLMLCSGKTKGFANKYYIYNPTINQFTTLPTFDYLGKPNHVSGMLLVFDPSNSPHYRIIYECGFEKNERRYHLGIYFSQTRTCKPLCTFTLDEDDDVYLTGGVYWNNTIHWSYDVRLLMYINLDEKTLRQIQTPYNLLGLDAECSNYIFESRDHLLLVEIIRPLTSKFKIHELKRDYSGWSVKYHVDLEEISGSFNDITNPYSRVTFEFAVLSLVLGQKEDDSFLVLEIPYSRVLRFNLASKTFHKLHYFTSRRPITVDLYRVYKQWPEVFPFMESLYTF